MQGYLKISMQVLGPGDEPKRSVSKIDDENVDIEANLLRPSGVRLQSATFRVKIFQAEDLPQSKYCISHGLLMIFIATSDNPMLTFYQPSW